MFIWTRKVYWVVVSGGGRPNLGLAQVQAFDLTWT